MLFEERYQAVLRKIERELIKVTREYKNPDEKDVYAPDGVVSYGHRRVAKDGSIRVAHQKWQNDLLKPLAGRIVGFCVTEYWIPSLDIYWRGYPDGEHLFRIHSQEEKDND
ncbi:hypothetical protein ACR3H8_20170 [Pseudomonas aeruginosa]|uniref:hypothetical protein n=1 Tax=Pseudomonas aeruginosa TaxID=287 RepID=UPI000E32BF01|nr:hypothetical protein [Pseudomonas aeruginosa]MCC0301130.1 hypothetical protein [Pseudomonas aeruginosa]MCC0408529.1 hypothetical protein [Pseudomonas aeruginosa]MCC0433671.1 hypothetical protein [Pseudomonas aeruginosa]MCR3806707.1 hypothetical protein [Pseudomonas aeruginosa]MCT5450511.1 hypothetical protein [Pseudomonas aeruginosa]